MRYRPSICSLSLAIQFSKINLTQFRVKVRDSNKNPFLSQGFCWKEVFVSSEARRNLQHSFPSVNVFFIKKENNSYHIDLQEFLSIIFKRNLSIFEITLYLKV